MVDQKNPRNPARRSGRPHNSLTRDELLAAARAVFSRCGFEGTSMEAVAGQLGIRKASLFHHFPSKEALYISVMEETVGQLEVLLAYVMEPIDGPFSAPLDRLSGELTRYLGGHPEVACLLYRDLMFNGPYFEGAGRDRLLALISRVIALFEDGMRRGEVLRQDARHLTLSVLGLHFSFFAAAELRGELLAGGRTDPVEARVRETTRQVRRLCGIAAET